MSLETLFFLKCRISSTAAVNSDTDPAAGRMAIGRSGFLQMSCWAAGLKKKKNTKQDLRNINLTGIFYPHYYKFNIVTAKGCCRYFFIFLFMYYYLLKKPLLLWLHIFYLINLRLSYSMSAGYKTVPWSKFSQRLLLTSYYTFSAEHWIQGVW